ncbi:hypothetical protein AYO21_02759 [Fonsecaea monophora]|uniref:DUF1857-domain-containing protein n=2 Tax=Fonsecaea TaxID=40354 RepID=A0A0D2FCU0_9EURO|nr:uncharacterized protein Z517_03672 [Fonsecaea pedrosoi CBS 271.37]XP_022515092.1 hypothetical protein AYO21_02759 [Fonsecaea monophora]KAH0836119.1 hypothetical protein FOPE_04491 [Fonsecaea pedrosoi]KIW84422.1 hypothetical protein Z517_03672 [Fonsecaea pedrosoi CBS 271.37]OAG43140.1 hypothetical protein AYO21_02759 [Fonsecaea monophora]
MTPSNNIAYTAPINPPSTSPKLTISQIWQGLELKIRAGQDFVGGALLSTDVISESKDEQGRPVTVREVVFRDGNRRVKETCVAYEAMKVEFHQPDGSKVQNIISQGAGPEGEDLYMTYTFEWLHPECEGDVKALEEKRQKETKVAKMAVEETIRVMREMVKDGRIK